MQQMPALSPEVVMERRLRRNEANLELCLRYVRALGEVHLDPRKVRSLEREHEEALAAIDEVGE